MSDIFDAGEAYLEVTTFVFTALCTKTLSCVSTIAGAEAERFREVY
jgi:hypothetical protein